MQFEERQTLPAYQLVLLREKRLIENEEYAYIAGDLLVAENVKTSSKRVLGQASEILSESKKRILKG